MADRIEEGFPNPIKPDKTYLVQLKKGVPFAGTTLNPSKVQRISGAQLIDFLGGEHKDAFYGGQEAH